MFISGAAVTKAKGADEFGRSNNDVLVWKRRNFYHYYKVLFIWISNKDCIYRTQRSMRWVYLSSLTIWFVSYFTYGRQFALKVCYAFSQRKTKLWFEPFLRIELFGPLYRCQPQSVLQSYYI